jgi:hypothetical protein
MSYEIKVKIQESKRFEILLAARNYEVRGIG